MHDPHSTSRNCDAKNQEPLPAEVWVVCSKVEAGKYSSTFVTDHRHSAMEHAAEMSEDSDAVKAFGPFRVARYVRSEKRPTEAELLECIKFWRHYSLLNESGQDDITGEKEAMLEKMEEWL